MNESLARRCSFWLRENRLTVWAGLLLAAIPVVVTSGVFGAALLHEETIVELPVWILGPVFLGLGGTIAFGATPATLVAACSGYLFGWWSVPLVFGSYLEAVWITATLAQRIDRGRFVESLRWFPRAQRYLVPMRQRQLPLIILCKLSPILPFTLTNLLFVVSGVKKGTLILGSMIGMLPRTLLAIWIGRQMSHIAALLENPARALGPSSWMLLLLLLTTLGLGVLARRILSRAAPVASTVRTGIP